MEEIVVVRKRSRVWPVLLALLVLIVIAVVVVLAMGGADEVMRQIGLNPIGTPAGAQPTN